MRLDAASGRRGSLDDSEVVSRHAFFPLLRPQSSRLFPLSENLRVLVIFSGMARMNER
jgi:hypothetical protein